MKNTSFTQSISALKMIKPNQVGREEIKKRLLCVSIQQF